MTLRTLLAFFASLAIATTTLAGMGMQPASADSGSVVRTEVQRRDANCSDFNSQAAAQQYFINHGGPDSDPDGLDGDGDGIACQSNPCPCSTDQGGGNPPPPPPAPKAQYAAIALNLKGRAATSANYSSREGALKQAVRVCNRGASSRFKCVRIGSVRNDCAAVWFRLDKRGNVVSTGPDRARFATGVTLQRAARNARNGHRYGRVAKTCA